MALGATVVAPTILYVSGHFIFRGQTHYHLMVSPDFTHEQQQEIRQAARKWERAVGNRYALTIQVEVGKCPDQPGAVDACLAPTPYLIACADTVAVGCTTSNHYSRKVELDVSCYPGALSHTAQHEMGHLFGLKDSQVKGTVMYYSVVCDTQIQPIASQNVSQTDVRAYMKEKQ